MAFYGGDWVTKQPTAIAWKWVGSAQAPKVVLLGESFDTRKVFAEEIAMLEAFRRAYDQADQVTGHYVRNFDLPVLNARMMRHGLPLLGKKMVLDTKNDLARAHGISKSQENLGAMFELEHPKIPMNTTLWELGNALVPEGIEATRTRVIGDVEQHIELRTEMIDLGYLAPPSEWKPQGGSGRAYVP